MDRRRGDRRRAHVLFSDWRYAVRGRRRGGRRNAELPASGVDWHPTWLLVVSMAILVLSTLDAVFTLELMSRGVVEEANPIMRLLMELDLQLFANFKLLATGTAVIILVACSTTRLLQRLPAHTILQGILFLYVGIIGYELYLLQI